MTIARVKNWVSGEVLTASDLNDEFDNILAYLNSGTLTFGGSLTVTGTITASNLSGTNTGDVAAASTTEQLTGTNAVKTSSPDSVAALWEQGADVASAGTISLGEGGFFHVTGVTTITDIDFATDKAGRAAWVEFTGILTLTHHATTLILPTGANIVTAAGDTACFVSEGSDAVRCVAYQRKDGTALAGGGISTTLTSAHILVGNAGNVATDVAMTGDVAISNAGVTAIGAGKVTSAMLANMAANSIKLRNAGSSGVPTDAIYTDITTKAVPVSGDFVLGWDAAGALKKYDTATLPPYGTAATASGSLATEILADTPTAYWKCDDASTQLTDSGGGGYHMTTVSGTPAYANTYLLPGDNSLYAYIKGTTDAWSITSALGTSPPLSGDYSLCFIYCSNGDGTNNIIFFFGLASSETEADNLQAGVYSGASPSSSLNSWWESGGGTDRISGTPITFYIPTFTPMMVHLVKDGTAKTLTWYVNGRKLGSAGTSFTTNPTGGTGSIQASIGYNGSNTTGNFVVGHVAFFNAIKLTAARCHVHANAAGLAGH